MSSTSDRPKKGLPLLKAFAKWSDPAKYQILVEIAGTPDLPPINHSDKIANLARRKEYDNLREETEREFCETLAKGETIFASAIEENSAAGREVIEPGLWELMDADYDEEIIGGNGQCYEKLEFFEKTAIPSNVLRVPEWLAASPAAAAHGASGDETFEHDANYEHVWIRHTFTLGPVCSKVIMLLAEAAQTDRPWIGGKKLLIAAGSKQSKMSDVFYSVVGWDLLIESDSRGQYRLRHRRS